MKIISMSASIMVSGLMMGCATSQLDKIASCDDTALLEEIAINAQPAGCHAYVGNTVYAALDAVKRIENRAALEKIRDGAVFPAVREAAADRLVGRTVVSDEDRLVETALNDRPFGAYGYSKNTIYQGLAAVVRLSELGEANSLQKISRSAKLPAMREATAL